MVLPAFETELIWKGGKQANLNARDNPLLRVASPPAFGGPPRLWCPEELLLASIASCLMSTFVYFVEQFRLALAAYASRAEATLAKTPNGLRFSGVTVRIDVTWADKRSVEKSASLSLRELLDKYCPVSAALNCPVAIEMIEREERRGSTRE